MSLEQVGGEPPPLASDVSSVGVLLHKSLTGCPVFQRSNVADAVKTASS